MMVQKITSDPVWSTIKSLLFKHDCVIVPQFGGFVCNKESAKIDQVSHIVLPPGKRVMFNQNLKVNDGLLALNVSLELNISYTEAIEYINSLVLKLQEELTQKKQIEIDHFGTFRLNAEANYVFLPDKQNNFYYGSFGLFPLQAKPGGEQKSISTATRIFKDRTIVTKPRKFNRAKYTGLKVLTLALIAMLGINGYLYLNQSQNNGGIEINTTGIHSWFDSLFSKQNQAATPVETIPAPEVKEEITTPVTIDTTPIVEPDFVEYNVKNLALVLSTFEEVHSEENIVNNPVAAPELPIQTSTKTAKGYYIIGGVFCKAKNAERFYEELKAKGFKAELLLNEKINCNRVSYQRVATYEEAVALMDSIQKNVNPEAWIYTAR